MMSSPIVESNSPNVTDVRPLANEEPATAPIAVKPSRIKAKYSGGPNRKAKSANVGLRSVTTITPKVPAMNEPMVAIPSALAARPCLAIW
jgi:hypothetical protein